jgi:hypothetical protein
MQVVVSHNRRSFLQELMPVNTVKEKGFNLPALKPFEDPLIGRSKRLL